MSPKPKSHQTRFSNHEIFSGKLAKEKFEAALKIQKEEARKGRASFNKTLNEIVDRVIFKS